MFIIINKNMFIIIILLCYIKMINIKIKEKFNNS